MEKPARLAPQPAKVLALLESRPGEIVSREEICRAIWGDGVHVDFEAGLNSCIKQVRAALGDRGVIETLPKRGYRLQTDITTKAQRTQRNPAARNPAWVWSWRWAAAAALVFLCVFSLLIVKGPPRHRPLLAVLPFEAGDDSLTEEITTQLTRFQPDRLGIIARTSAMQFAGTRKSIPEIGRELGVDYIVEGSVRREAGRLRITAQLIQVRDQTQLWAATYYDENQAHVARRMVGSLAAELLPGVALASTPAATANSQAMEAYLRGQHSLALRTDRGFEEAVEHFARAIHEDPNYALAYVGLADTYSLMGEYYVLNPDAAFPKAREAAQHALDIDDSLAEAQTSMAFVMAKYEWNWTGAEARFRRAIALNSAYPTTHQWYAELLSAMGRHDQAIAEIARARQLDPLSLIIQSVDGYIHYNARRYDEAIALCRAVLDRDPHYLPALEFLTLAYQRKGMQAEALALEGLASEQASDGVHSVRFMQPAQTSVPPNGRDAAGRNAEKPHASPYSVAAHYAVLGQRNQAFRWLDLACERHDALVTFAKVDPNFDALRGDPRFPGLLKRVGLTF